MTKPKLLAEPAYENAHLVACDLLDRIGELLHDTPAPGVEEHPIDWGHVGNITHVNGLLSQVVAFLEGRDPESIPLHTSPARPDAPGGALSVHGGR